jgi:hypothetical protein
VWSWYGRRGGHWDWLPTFAIAEVVFVAFDVGIEVAYIEEKGSIQVILHNRDDLVLNESPQLPFTDPEIGGGFLGTQ